MSDAIEMTHTVPSAGGGASPQPTPNFKDSDAYKNMPQSDKDSYEKTLNEPDTPEKNFKLKILEDQAKMNWQTQQNMGEERKAAKETFSFDQNPPPAGKTGQ